MVPLAPRDNVTVFSEIFFDDRIYNTKKNTIAVGDWNVGIFLQFNYHNYFDGNNYRAESRNKIIAWMEEFDLTDIFRERHPDPDETCKQGYWTWKCKNDCKKVARLDYWLISANVYPYVNETKIVTTND